MKKTSLFFVGMLLCIAAFAQTVPHSISYQAVARSTSGTVVPNTTLSVIASILNNSPTGTVAYSEKFSVSTNQYGLFTMHLGQGTAITGTFDGISWGGSSHWLKIEIDFANTGLYTLLGTSELLSVPYALFSENSGTGGPTGPTGADGAVGPQGVAGPSGADGINGVTGPTGPAGANGTNGTNGTNGLNGVTGPTGAAGINGVAGPTGPQGITGPTGSGGGGGGGVTGPTGPTGPAGSGGGSWVEATGSYTSYGTPLPCGASGTACASPTSYAIGSGSLTSTSTTDIAITPFKGFYTQGRSQYLFTAAELIAAGMVSGTVKQLKLNVNQINSTAPYQAFTISIGCTSNTDMSGGWVSGLTSVYGPLSFTPVLGNNTFTLSTTYNWDGTSNLVVQFCYNNGNLNYTNSDNVVYSNTTAPMNYYGYADTEVDPCGAPTALTTGSATQRPNITFGSCNVASTSASGTYQSYTGGVVVGSPTGGYKGPGTINAQAVYDDNLLLTDYVFDHYFEGKIKAEDAAKHGSFKMTSMDELKRYIEQERHLPSIQGRDFWNKNGKFSLGELSQQMWEAVEIQAIYITELNEQNKRLSERIEKLEMAILAANSANNAMIINNTDSPPKNMEELRKAIEKINSDPSLSPTEKSNRIKVLKGNFIK